MEAARATTLSVIRVAQLSPVGMKLLRPEEAPKVALSVQPKLEERVIEVRASGKIHELQVEPQTDEARIRFELKRRTCDVCGLKSGRKHEAVLQVRGELTGEKRSEVRVTLERIATEARRRERAAFISKVEERLEGLDFYVNPASLARRMARVLKSKFGAGVKESRKLVGQTRDGRKKYRLTISARIPSKAGY